MTQARKQNGWLAAAARRAPGRPQQPDPPPTPSEFDLFLAQLNVNPQDAVAAACNPVLRQWIRSHHQYRFVPEAVLKVVGIETHSFG